MKAALAVGFFSLVALLPALAAAEREVRHAFPVQPGCTLKIDTYRGMITVTESDEAMVRVSIQMQVGGDTEADAARVLAGLQLDVEARERMVSIFARNPRETRARWVWREDEQVGLFYRITVPRHCHLEVKNGNGDLTVGRLQGRMSARVQTGTVFFRGVDGSVDATVGQGDIVISRCSGPVKAVLAQGLIRMGTIGGPLDLTNASGSAEVMWAKSAVQGKVTAGHLRVGLGREIAQDSALTASGGNILARIDATADCEIQASSKWGRVNCELPLVTEPGRNGKRKLFGRLNRGGPLVALRADGGNVTIEAGAPPFE